LIPLGRGADYAWTLTTGYSDAVDVRAEKLCDPADPDGQVPASSNNYLYKGECVAMEERTETFDIKPPPTDPGPPSTEERTFYRTVHGPVFDRGTIKGAPVAFVKQRFFWMKEIDSLPSFYEWNTSVDSIDDFAAAAENFTMSFNSFYADSENIGYFHVGEYPVRPQGVHPSLPVWGTGDWEWSESRRDYALQPKIVNPDQGWVANWNNKPTRSWDNHDGFKWGAIQRVRLLMDRMRELFVDGGQAEVSDIVDVIRDAATRDARGAYLGPLLLKRAAKSSPQDAPETYGEALATVQTWIDAGAHRYNLDRDDAMDDGPALAVFDAWYDRLVHRIFDDELGEGGYGLMADAPVTNYSPSDGGGFWFDFSSYLFDLVQKKQRERAFSRNYCDDSTTPAFEGCNAQIAASLIDALAALVAEQGADMSAWTVPAENISFTENANSATAGSVADIPWQNRGSENHIVEVLDPAP
jgi:acyl-homoserine lactone acylase PvdQ